MMLGLQVVDLNYILEQISHFSEIEKAVVFGSRAKGTQKNGSDIDLAIFGEQITFDTVSTLHALLEEEGPMPYLIDVIDYTHLKHQALKDHIDRVGVVIYEK